MGRIRQLDMATANGIAAGEVVERPSSVVKELVENAMDAGATVITVEIEGGGISLIRVTDDGCGMDEEDARLAFTVHATSKLAALTDLFDLHTMGFRGEALSSIGAASKVTLRTKQPGDKSGTEVVVEAGRHTHIGPVGTQSGTSVTVRDLFFNLPARYKFLKKDNTEAQYIIQLCERFALVRPDISFRLLHQGKEVLHTPGNNDPESTLYCIYGKKIVDSCIPVDEKHGDILIRGYVGKPEIARSNRNEQIVFVNERMIRSKTITSAIDEAYKTMLMKGRHAFVILSLYISSQLVDVNVHPQKAEVRFWNDGEIFRSVCRTIQNALLSRPHLVEYETFPEMAREGDFPQKECTHREGVILTGEAVADSTALPTKSNSVRDQPDMFTVSEEKAEYLPRIPDPFDRSICTTDPNHSPSSGPNPNDLKREQADAARQLGFDFTIEDLLEGRIIGIAFSTYILIEIKNNLILLDQHAAHEKILFEQLLEKKEAADEFCIPTQTLLTPEMIHLSAADFHFLSENEKNIERAGFIFAVMGEREIALRGIPSLSVEINPVEAFLLTLDSMEREFPLTDDNMILLLASTACKAAVKGHDRLHGEEIKRLLSDLAYVKNPYHCPHGRPILIRLSQRELEKKFKRIV